MQITLYVDDQLCVGDRERPDVVEDFLAILAFCELVRCSGFAGLGGQNSRLNI